MKTFIIVVETAIIAFVAGGCIGMLAERQAQQEQTAQEDETKPEA